MDMSLIRINLKTLEVFYAGANNPLYHFKNMADNPVHHDGFNEEEYVGIVKADKQPIGQYHKKVPFKNHVLTVSKGDTLVMFTDGYADQFGGEKGKKLMYKPFRQLLLKNMSKPLEEQKKLLSDHFEQWKGSLVQVDDVCVIGIRL